MKISPRYRSWILLFALWFAIQPLAVTIVSANDLPQPEFELDEIDGIVDIEKVMTASEYLEYMLTLRGRTKKEAEAKTWGDWMMALSGAYMLMDDGCADVFSFYSAVEVMQPNMARTPFYFRALSKASQKVLMAFAFLMSSPTLPNGVKVIGRVTSAISGTKVGQAVGQTAKWGSNQVSTIGKWTSGKLANSKLYNKGVGFIQRKANMFNGFKKMGTMASKFQNNAKIFITHMAPPCGYKDGAGLFAKSKLFTKTELLNRGTKIGTGNGFQSYWRWVARKTGVENIEAYRSFAKSKGICTNRGAKVIGNVKGAAQTVGIGLCVLGLALDSYGIYTSDDRKGGRFDSYALVKNYVGIALGASALVAMFCVPVIGQVIGAITLVWFAATLVADQFGAYNKKWKAAYKNSYWYLYNNDPEFKSFYDNRSYLNKEEKAAALLVAEMKYGDFIKEQVPEAGVEEEQTIDDRNRRVFTELEKQGVLVSYYSQKGYTLPDFGMDRLKELWQMKADYMSWKPTAAEEEKASKRGFWGKVGHYVNPMTYVSWAGDKMQSTDYKKTIQEYNLQKTFFNPDYVLIKKYQNWITANKYRGGIFDIVGLRMEQSPFNYIPMVAIDTAAWNEELLEQAFDADAMQIGTKEMIYFREQIKLANQQVEESIDSNDKTVEDIREIHLQHAIHIREALSALITEYNDDPDKENKDLMKICKKAYGWRWNKDNGDCTPRNIIKVYKGDIESSLTNDPLSLSHRAAELVLMVTMIKSNIDMCKMMTELGEEKKEVISNFDEDFTNYDFAKFLKEGTFLDVEGSTVMDWLSDIYPTLSELEKYTNLYMREVDDFKETADESNSDTRSRFLWFDKTGMHPKELLSDINKELENFKNLSAQFEDVKDELDIRMPITENDAIREGVYPADGFQIVSDEDIYLDDPIMADDDE